MQEGKVKTHQNSISKPASNRTLIIHPLNRSVCKSNICGRLERNLIQLRHHIVSITFPLFAQDSWKLV